MDKFMAPNRQADGRGRSMICPWTVERTGYVLRDRWLTVRADECTVDGGRRVSPYYVLEYPDWVQMVVCDDDNQILIAEQYRHAGAVVSVELPCGGVEESDQSPEAAARRELAEETGLVGGEFQRVARLSPNPATHSNVVHTFVVRGAVQRGCAVWDPSEAAFHRWASLSEILELIESGAFVQSMHVASLFLAARALDMPLQ